MVGLRLPESRSCYKTLDVQLSLTLPRKLYPLFECSCPLLPSPVPGKGGSDLQLSYLTSNTGSSFAGVSDNPHLGFFLSETVCHSRLSSSVEI